MTPIPGKRKTKGFKGRAQEDPRYSDFGGYKCPHYRRRPEEVYANLNCRACPNLPTCARIEAKANPQPKRAQEDTPETQQDTPPARAQEGSDSTPTTTTQETTPDTPPDSPVPPPPLGPDAELSEPDASHRSPSASLPGNRPHPSTSVPPSKSETQEKTELDAGYNGQIEEGYVSQTGLVPKHRRLPVITQGGLNLGALRQGLPRIECNNCAISEDCPKFEPGAVCAFNEIFDQFDTRNSDDLYALQQMLVEWDMDRTFKFMLLERLTTGGVADPKVSAQMDSLQRRIQLLHDMQVAKSPNPRTGAPAVHLHHHAPSPTTGGAPGILSQLFGGSSDEDVQDAEYEEKPSQQSPPGDEK